MKNLSNEHEEDLITKLGSRFQKYKKRHADLQWDEIRNKLKDHPKKLYSLYQMENTGGEPDVIGYDYSTGEYIFCDCSPESPSGRRSFCYDKEALESRKERKPKNTAVEMSRDMGISLLNEEQYRSLQKVGVFDSKTSSWIETPAKIRRLGGALFGDFRYGQVFIYHNGAQSYYAARGFRGILRL